MTSTNRLQFVMSLLDRVSGPLDNMQNRLQQFSQRAEAGFTKVGMGAAGLAGSVLSVGHILSSGNDFMAGLGEVKSLGVAEDSLAKLSKTSLDFAARYNLNAADVVRSSYDIQSAIAGLNGDELARFTGASTVLAKATKSDAGTITSYVGTMYGIFQQQAEKMGKGEWVDMLAGQTAKAVQLFKTTGPNMAAAFSSVGASATTMGASLSDQMAILGTLQATMGGAEAGTKYRAFLKGVGKAQEELGLTFTDSHGKMLPMVNILQAIKGKFGEIDTVAESDKLQKAFGSDEAVALVKLLSTNIDGLSGSMQQLGDVQGLGQASTMAEAMLTPMDKLKGSTTALYTKFSLLLNDAISPLIEKLSGGSTKLSQWLEMFPNLGKWVAYATLGVMALVAGVSLLTIIGGIATLTTAGWAAACGIASGALGILNTVLGIIRVAALLFSAALWANPITWMVVGVIALVAACALLWFKWDVLKQAFLDTSFGQGVMQFFSGVSLLATALIWKIGELYGAFSNSSFAQFWVAAFGVIGSTISGAIDWIASLASSIGELLAKFASLGGSAIFQAIAKPFQMAGGLLGGIGGGLVTAAQAIAPTSALTPAAPGTIQDKLSALNLQPLQSSASPIAPSVIAPQPVTMPGGAGKQVAQAINSKTSNGGTQIGEMHIHTSEPMTPDQLSHLTSIYG